MIGSFPDCPETKPLGDKMKDTPSQDSEGKGFIFRLFVAGDEQHSKTARKNIRKLCESRIDEAYEIEVVDVLKSYKAALENNIFLTPALIMVSPAPAVTRRTSTGRGIRLKIVASLSTARSSSNLRLSEKTPSLV